MATCKNTSPAAEGDTRHPALADRLGLALKSAYQLDTLISRLDAELDDRDEVNVGLGEIAVAKLLIGRCHALNDALIGLCDHNAESAYFAPSRTGISRDPGQRFALMPDRISEEAGQRFS